MSNANVNDAAFWDNLYATSGDGWELGGASPPLARAVAALAPGKAALVLGCGRGHEARLLAGVGFPRVVAVDFAPKAIADARRLTPEGGPAARAIDWREQDLFTLGLGDAGAADAGAFDLVLEHTCFCAVDPARRAEWRDVVRRVLAPGGTLLGLFYAHGRAGGPPFTTTREEVERLLLEARGFAIESAEVPPDSIERRAGQEILLRARRR